MRHTKFKKLKHLYSLFTTYVNNADCRPFRIRKLKNFILPPKIHILLYSNGLAIQHVLPNIGHVKMNNVRKGGHFEFDQVNIFKVHPHLKYHISFYSNGLAI